MKRLPVALIVGVQIVLALALAVVAWYGVQRGQEVTDLRAEVADAQAELAETQLRLVMVEAERDSLRERVAALEAALIAAGVDPNSVPAEAAADPSSAAAPSREPSEPRRNTAPPAPPPVEPEPAPPQEPPPPPPSEPEPQVCVLGLCVPTL